MRFNLRRRRRRPPLVYVHSRRGQGKKVVERLYAEDREPEPAPYGFNLAERRGVRMSYSEDDFPYHVSQARIFKHHADFLHALVNIFRARRADVIWTMLEWEWIPIAAMQWARLTPSIPTIANSVWLIDLWSSWSNRRKSFINKIMSDELVLTLHSRQELDAAQVMFPQKQFRLVYFGISTQAFPVVPPRHSAELQRPIRIYSIGQDRTRDWSTLLQAFGNDQRFDVRIVCRWISEVVDVGAYGNLETSSGITISQQRANYDWADIVVITMLDNGYSGITVGLEAAARGRPVICSRTGGVPTYFTEDEVTYVPVGDAERLRSAALALMGSDSALEQVQRAQARFVAEDYSADGMVARYIALSKAVVPDLTPD